MANLEDKPILVATTFPVAGHTAGLLQISEHLIKKGFKIYFVTGSEFKAAVEKMGAEFIENPWEWEPIYTGRPADADEIWNIKHIFADSTPVAHRALVEALERVRREHPNHEVILLHESISGGFGPLVCGAPLPKGYTSIPKAINFHTSVYAAKDYKLPPFGPGLPYDPTPENLAVWRSIHEAMEPAWASLSEYYNDIYKALGATRPVPDNFFDQLMTTGEVTIMATSPNLEYPRETPNPKVRLIGGLPLKPLNPAFGYPAWWSTITTNAALPAGSSDKKKVVFVTQGTAHRDYTELVIPTIKALAGRTDLIVVATLGFRGAELDSSLVEVPENTIVVDYFPYDAVLPYADVFVSNAGYGGFMHGIMNGVPMVLAGTLADKAEVCARAEWAGVAVNLRTQGPGEEAIRAAVDKVLDGKSYKQRALELKRENEELDSLRKVEEVLEELAGRR